MSAVMIENVAELVTQLDSDDPVVVSQARRALRQAADALIDPKKAAERGALADALVAELNAKVDPPAGPRMTNVPDGAPPPQIPQHAAATRRYLCQILATIADDAQVPELARALQDLDVRDAVRGVLGSIPTIVSVFALTRELNRAVGPEFRAGVLGALGQGRWRDAMAATANALKDSDPTVRLAALEALASFPEAGNDKLFAAATQSGTPREQARAWAARVRLAETLYWAGETRDAMTIYQRIADDPAEGPWRKAARVALEREKA
ncbi:MAG: HEAT repeat domain-containing protein [Planctomycetes bacterium]|nr:HEAT repeat domain-containing protein [Planctomycetota bacterium]